MDDIIFFFISIARTAKISPTEKMSPYNLFDMLKLNIYSCIRISGKNRRKFIPLHAQL